MQYAPADVRSGSISGIDGKRHQLRSMPLNFQFSRRQKRSDETKIDRAFFALSFIELHGKNCATPILFRAGSEKNSIAVHRAN
jgi:hypothetical protein